MVDDSFPRLERELGILLRRAQASSAKISRTVHPDLEPAAYTLLALIARTPGVRASELAEYIGVGRGTMSRQLAKLGELGLITRRPDPDDFRGQLLELTVEGSRRMEQARQARRDFLRRALGHWSDEDVDRLAGQLERLNEDLGAARRSM